jgi:hypothetical protein
MSSNFAYGFNNGITIRGIPLTVLHPGQVFWVNNSSVLAPGGIGGSNNNKGDYRHPFSTIDYAIGMCTANRGDVIVVMPGHVEAITAAAALVADIAGVAIVGLGSGAKRAKISFTTISSADIDITAANVTFYNIEFQSNIADLVSAIDVSGIAGLTFENCYFTQGSASLDFVDMIDLATGASDIYVNNCKFIGNSADNDSFITGVALDGLYIQDSYFAMNTAQTSVVGLIETSGNATNVVIKDCHFRSNIDGALFLDFNGAANSGLISNCYFSSIDTAGATTAGFDFTGGHVFECYVAGEPDTFGLVGGGTVYNDA